MQFQRHWAQTKVRQKWYAQSVLSFVSETAPDSIPATAQDRTCVAENFEPHGKARNFPGPSLLIEARPGPHPAATAVTAPKGHRRNRRPGIAGDVRERETDL
jgi:hypothetical protein